MTGLTFSFAKGILHPYYNVALAPAIGALVGIGLAVAWKSRHDLLHRAVLGLIVRASAVWAWFLLERTSSWQTWLHPVVLYGGVLLGVAIAALPDGVFLNRRVATWAPVAIVAVLLAAPLAYSLQIASTAHAGSLPSAGPAGAISGQGAGPGGGRAASRAAVPSRLGVRHAPVAVAGSAGCSIRAHRAQRV